MLLFLTACKGGNDYASMAKQANAARVDAGSEVAPAPAGATLLGSGQNSPAHLQLEGDTVFWLNEGGRTGTPGLFKLPKAGGPTVSLMEEPELVAMAADANSVYWLAPHVGKIGKVSRGGGGKPEVLGETTSILRGMVIDDSDVFWAENEAIMRVSKAGGKAQPVCVVGLPDFLTIDGAYVYWYSMISGVIQKAPKKGGPVSKVYADDQHSLHTFFIDGPDLFVSFGAENKMVIQRLPKSGGKPTTLIEGQDPATDFAIDANNIYWITEDNIFKVPRSGGAATKVVEKLEHGRDVVVDDRFVYWADRSGRIQRLPK